MINQYFSDQAVTHLDSSRTDGFKFEDRARKLTQKLANSSGNISMGIRGGWGEGKTSFLKTMQRVGMAKAHSYYNDGKVGDEKNLKFLEDKEFAGRSFPVFFNAWQYEREENPLAALCGTIVNQLSVNKYFLKTAKNNIELKSLMTNLMLGAMAFGKAFKFEGEIGTCGIPGFPSFLDGKIKTSFDPAKSLTELEKTKFKPINLIQTFKQKYKDLNITSVYYQIFDLLEQIGTTIEDSNGKKQPFKIILLIDDLDRCEADKVKFLLDNLKLVLSSPAFAFVFGVNQEVVFNQIKNQMEIENKGKIEFRADSAEHYMEKIIPFYVDLPEYEDKFEKFFDTLVGEVVDKEEKEKFNNNYKKIIKRIWGGTDKHNPRKVIEHINKLIVDMDDTEDVKMEGLANDESDINKERTRANVMVTHRLLETAFHRLKLEEVFIKIKALANDEILEYIRFVQGYSNDSQKTENKNTPEAVKVNDKDLLEALKSGLDKFHEAYLQHAGKDGYFANKEVFNKFKSLFQNQTGGNEWREHFGDWLKFESLRKKAVILKTGEKPGIQTASDYFYEALSQAKDLEGYSKSIELYTEAILLIPKYTMAYNNRGNSYRQLSELENKQENLDKAMQDYTKAIELDPNYARAYNNLSALYFSQNQNAKSIDTAKKSVDILKQKIVKDTTNNANQYMYLAAKNLAGIEEDRTTLKHLAKFIQQNPDFQSKLYSGQYIEWIRIENFPEFKKLLSSGLSK